MKDKLSELKQLGMDGPMIPKEDTDAFDARKFVMSGLDENTDDTEH